MKQFITQSIKRKIILFCIATSLVVVACFFFFFIIQTRSALQENTAVSFEKIAEEIYFNINKIIVKGLEDIKTVTADPVVLSENRSQHEKLAVLKRLKEILRAYEDISLVAPNGRIVVSTDYNYRGSWKHKKYFKEALLGKTTVSNVHYIPDPIKLIISFTAPVYDNRGTILYIAILQLNMKDISDIITHVKINETGIAYLVDNHNRIISHSDTEIILRRVNSSIVSQVEKDAGSLSYTDQSGIRMFGNYFSNKKLKKIPGGDSYFMDWKVIVAQDQKEVFKRLDSTRNRTLLFSLLLFILIIIASLRFSNTITNPLEMLTESVRIIGNGNFHHRVDIQSDDEIGHLADSFNIMSENLNNSNEQVSSLLEVTKELTQANTALSACSTIVPYLSPWAEKEKILAIDLYFPQKSGDSYIGYTVWENNMTLEYYIPYDIPGEKASRLHTIEKITLVENRLVVPIKSGTKIFSLFELKGSSHAINMNASFIQFIAGITRSLALVLENIEAEENRRLAEVGRTAATIIHDFKNHIGTIIGYAEMAGDEQVERGTQLEYLEIIEKEAAFMAEIAHEVLEYSRGELVVQVREIVCEKYFEDLVMTLSPVFTEHHITFEHRIQYKGLFTLDPNRIRRVIHNLAANARDAVLQKIKNGMDPEKGEFSLVVEKEGNDLFIRVTDNGTGIPEVIRTTLFEPFVTLGGNQSTGLGMAIVKKIIDAHGGEISFSTEIGKGTEFIVRLPG
ncbi:MAG: HAMP domain-containing protein [bacterium]|nr:HAMP domain-containing protein [bacterium]